MGLPERAGTAAAGDNDISTRHLDIAEVSTARRAIAFKARQCDGQIDSNRALTTLLLIAHRRSLPLGLVGLALSVALTPVL